MKHIFSIITAFLLAPLAALHAAEPKLNVLLILSDDHSYPHVGCYGNKDIMTPNLDKFATEGMRFDRAYVACPPCVPALLGESKTGRETLIEQGSPIAVRQGNWKLISTGKAPGNKKKVVVEDKDRAPRDTGAGGGLQLFNLVNDLAETKNLADQQPEKTKELAEILRKARETGRTR